MKRTQTWVATKIPNLFMLKESGVYYLRVKPKGGRQIRESLQTTNFKIARVGMRERLLELGVEAQVAGRGISHVNSRVTAGDCACCNQCSLRVFIIWTSRSSCTGFVRKIFAPRS